MTGLNFFITMLSDQRSTFFACVYEGDPHPRSYRNQLSFIVFSHLNNVWTRK